MKKNNFEVSINSIAFSTKEEPTLPEIRNSSFITWTYTPHAKSWHFNIYTDNIRKDKTYREFAATFSECMYGLKLSNVSFYSTDIKLNGYTNNAEKDIKLNSLIIELFNMAINETDEDIAGVEYNYYDYNNDVFISAYNNYWGMRYCSRPMGNGTTKTCIELNNYKPAKKGGHKPYELKKLWLKKLDQLPIIYQYLKIRKYNAGVDYWENKMLINYFSLADIQAYIDKLKAALTEYFNS